MLFVITAKAAKVLAIAHGQCYCIVLQLVLLAILFVRRENPILAIGWVDNLFQSDGSI
jgi:hypothetical protein